MSTDAEEVAPRGASGSRARSDCAQLGTDPEEAARAVALRLLTGAPRSRAQLTAALAARGVPDDAAARVLDRFTEVGLVDDDAYAQMLVRSRHAGRGLSRRALAVELRRRGVDDSTAAEAVAQVGDADEVEAARRLVTRALASTRGLDTTTRTRRTLAALGRRGYPPGLAFRLIREVLTTEGTAGDAALPDDALPDE